MCRSDCGTSTFLGEGISSSINQLAKKAFNVTKDALFIIHQATGLKDFIIGGLWDAKKQILVTAQATVC